MFGLSMSKLYHVSLKKSRISKENIDQIFVLYFVGFNQEVDYERFWSSSKALFN